MTSVAWPKPSTTTKPSLVEYDTLGRRVAAIDQNGKRTEYRYDDLGRLTGVKDANLNWTEYGYNELGQLIFQEDANDRRTYYEYDQLGRRNATILPLTQRSGMTYDEVGNLKTMTDFNGRTTTYIYDFQNRLTEKQFQDGSKVQYGYTLHGLQDTVTFRDSAGLISSFYDYDYDVRDRLTKRTDAIGGLARSIQYGYDQNSNQTSVTTASGTTTYSYDERNRLDLVKLNNVLQADYDYDAGSRLTKTSFGNGTEEIRVYDNLNRLKELTSKRGTVELSKYFYTLNKVGNRKTATETVNGQGRAIAYTYDDLYRLTDEVITDGINGNRSSSYTYDNTGNRLTKTVNGVVTGYAYDKNDRLLDEKIGGAIVGAYSYDNNGSTLTKTENGVTTTYNWNDEKRLVSATVGNTTTVEYLYNDQGIRVSSKQNGVETRYLLDEGIVANVWEEYAPNGAVQASYVYGNDLITQTQANQTSYYLVDGLGSTRILTDTTGKVLNSYGYEAFGQTVSQIGDANNKYQYAGEQLDAALGDYYLRQRFYDTSSGRFGRMDTYEGRQHKPLTLHKYIYAQNNSINGTDPTGLYTLSFRYRGAHADLVVSDKNGSRIYYAEADNVNWDGYLGGVPNNLAWDPLPGGFGFINVVKTSSTNKSPSEFDEVMQVLINTNNDHDEFPHHMEKQLDDYFQMVKQGKIKYNWFRRNSNAVAFTAAENLLGYRPHPMISFAPAWNRNPFTGLASDGSIDIYDRISIGVNAMGTSYLAYNAGILALSLYISRYAV
jgi:RHS repeat-associated protein